MATTVNPVVSISNVVPLPPDPTTTRELFTRVLFSDFAMATYGRGEYTKPSFEPQYRQALYFVVNVDPWSLGTPSQPQFVTDQAWNNNLEDAPSGFLTAVGSIMPKLFVPTRLLVDNGVRGSKGGSSVGTDLAKTAPYGEGDALIDDKYLFNWWITAASYGDWSADPYRVAAQSRNSSAAYVTVKNKDDALDDNSATLKLENGTDWPIGFWTSGSTGKLVVTGAFCVMVNVVPVRPGQANPDDTKDNSWNIKFEFGEVIMILQSSGALFVEVNGNRVRTQLSESSAKEVPPHLGELKDANKYIIMVHPVWNGIVVSNGVQDVRNTTQVSSVYVPKSRSLNILSPGYSTPFDTKAPADVEVGVNSNVRVAFGESMTVTSENCRFELAYVPLFFTHRCWFEAYWVDSKDSGLYSYDFDLWSIYTKNNVAGGVAHGSVNSWTKPDLGDASEYKRVQWVQNMPKPNRSASELYGYYLRTTEERVFSTNNGNGSFNLEWTGGTPGDPEAAATRFVNARGNYKVPGWEKWITNISVSLGIDGSSGSVTVDKYGIAGQDAEIVQDIGALVLRVTNGPTGTVGGTIFSGIAMGAGEEDSADGGTWNIPLVGLERKLEDIVLVSAPFFDGETAEEVTKFLTRYGGVRRNMAGAPNRFTDQLPASEDISTPMFELRTGTPISDAISQTMSELHYGYYIDRLGYMRFYELNLTGTLAGLPTYPGPDWKTGNGLVPAYTNTTIVSIDRNPDFDDLRNEIVMVALQQLQTTGSDVSSIPVDPIIVRDANVTNPDIPWMRGLVEGVPGVTTEAIMNEFLDRRKADTATYEIIGRTQIPGNARINPWDRWDGDKFFIMSVSHSIDFNSKTWTTDLEFSRGRE